MDSTFKGSGNSVPIAMGWNLGLHVTLDDLINIFNLQCNVFKNHINLVVMIDLR